MDETCTDHLVVPVEGSNLHWVILTLIYFNNWGLAITRHSHDDEVYFQLRIARLTKTPKEV